MLAHSSVKAAAIMIAGMLFIPLGDTAGKLLANSHGVSPMFIAWSRFAIGAVIVLIAFAGRGFEWHVLKNWRVWLRASLVAATIPFIMTALKTEPIANVYGAFFIGPPVAFLLSAVALGERITVFRFLLILAGFGGVLLVVQPGASFAPGLLYAVVAGVLYGCFLVASRWLAGQYRPRTLLLSQLVIAGFLTAPFALGDTPTLTLSISGLVLWSAAASAIGNLLLVIASRMADASRLAPLVYTQLLSATGLGLFVFGDVPDLMTTLGLAVIFAAGTAGYLSRNNTRPQR
ncbi:MAG: DMT family transporter [Ahrensia sp.]